jgi:Ca2+/Na+ antiporter
MMSLRYEDRELQIKLAELQADVQINLTVCFGFLALLFVVIIGLQQIYYALLPEEIVAKSSILVLMVGAAFIILFVIRRYFRKALYARNRMEELRKQYVW